MIKILFIIFLFTNVTFSSFPSIDYVESIDGTDVSFVQEVDRNQFTERFSTLSNDSLNKLDVSIKEDLVRTWIDICIFSKKTN